MLPKHFVSEASEVLKVWHRFYLYGWQGSHFIFPSVLCVNYPYRQSLREEINIYLLPVLSNKNMASLDNRSHGISAAERSKLRHLNLGADIQVCLGLSSDACV